MTQQAGPRPGDWVWLASTYTLPVLLHTHADRDDRTVTAGGHTGPVAGWAFTRCGIRTYSLAWDDAAGRFYIGHARGTQMPVRLLNPARVRPCKRCWR